MEKNPPCKKGGRRENHTQKTGKLNDHYFFYIIGTEADVDGVAGSGNISFIHQGLDVAVGNGAIPPHQHPKSYLHITTGRLGAFKYIQHFGHRLHTGAQYIPLQLKLLLHKAAAAISINKENIFQGYFHHLVQLFQNVISSAGRQKVNAA